MVWQSASWQREIKERVRNRDKNRCVVCGLDQQTHVKRYGSDLQVHRIVPGSEYSVTWGLCITLCDVCHDGLHGKGSWAWIVKKDPHDAEDLARRVRRSTNQDVREEGAWRWREAWGVRLRQFRMAVVGRFKNPLARFARMVNVSPKTVSDWECGRRKLLLSEAVPLAKALGITLEDLAAEPELSDDWEEAARERSYARAVVLRARELNEEEEVLARGAKLVWEIVGRADEARAVARKEVEERAAQAANSPARREFLKKMSASL